MSPAMRVRLAKNRCPEFDTLHSHIYIFREPKTDRYVTTSLPFAQYPLDVLQPEHSLHRAFYRAVNEQAASCWLVKYGEKIPSDNDLERGVPEAMLASDQKYPGPSILTPSESKVLEDSHAFGEVTLDIVFLIVEVLGWRPGKPVPDDDPGWITLWAEEEVVLGTIAVARHVLGMPHVEDGWRPAAVVELYDCVPLQAG